MEELLNTTLNAIKLDKDTNLLPENLKAGITCLGVEGTYEGSGQEINNQDKTITENGEYTADQGYTGLGTVTVNVSGGILQYETKAEMDEDTTQDIGTIAIVDDFRQLDFTSNANIYNVFLPPTITISPEENAIIQSKIGTSTWIYSSLFTIMKDSGSPEVTIRYTKNSGIHELHIPKSDMAGYSYVKQGTPGAEFDSFAGTYELSSSVTPGLNDIGGMYNNWSDYSALELSQMDFLNNQIKFYNTSVFDGVYRFNGSTWQHIDNNFSAYASGLKLGQKAYSSYGTITGTLDMTKHVAPIHVRAYNTGVFWNSIYYEGGKIVSEPNMAVLMDTRRMLDFGDKRYFIIYTNFVEPEMPEEYYELSRVYVTENKNAKITFDFDNGAITSDDASWTKYDNTSCIPHIHRSLSSGLATFTLSDIQTLADTTINLTPVATNQQIDEEDWRISPCFEHNVGYVLTNCEIVNTDGETVLDAGPTVNDILTGKKFKNAFGQTLIGTYTPEE